MEENCGNCHCRRDGACHRYPPRLTAGPLVIEKPVHDLPDMITLDSSSALIVQEGGTIYRVLTDGFPLVEDDGWCDEWKPIQ